MRIESMDLLRQRLEETIEEVSKDEEYVESLEALKNVLEEMEMYDLNDAEDELAMVLHEADGAYPMHKAVAKLLIDIYEDGIDSNNADAMCSLGALLLYRKSRRTEL